MTDTDFVFFHTSSNFDLDDNIPKIMVKSIKDHYPFSSVHQLTDIKSAKIEGVDQIHRFKGDKNLLMSFRILCYSEYIISRPTIFLDTDMIILKKFNIENLLGNNDVVLLKRSFNLNLMLNPKFKLIYGEENILLDFDEHVNQTFQSVYPFLGCFAIVKNQNFWRDCYNLYKNLSVQYHYWYGDQKALKLINDQNLYKIKTVREQDFSCPPDKNENFDPYILHFKGIKNKNLMLDYEKKLV